MTTPEQQQQHEFLMDEFRAGVTACLRSWSALRAAVDSGWGGAESVQKADDLRENIYKYMDGSCFPPKGIDVWGLEDALAIYMEEEFSVVLEDESEKQVAECLWHMYEDCSKGQVDLCRQVVASAKAAAAQANEFPVQLITSEQDEDDDDGEMDGETNSTLEQQAAAQSLSVQSYAAGSLFGIAPKKPAAPSAPLRQLGEAASEKPQPVLDDDGFAPVQRKARKPRAT